MKSSKKWIFTVQGQRVGCCRQCHPEETDDKLRYHREPVRAVCIRKPKVGFVRIGWYFERCGHVEVDEAIKELSKDCWR